MQNICSNRYTLTKRYSSTATGGWICKEFTKKMSTSNNNNNKTMYFAFGSNLLASRMHVMNPTAVRAGVGKLQDYKLDFVAYSKLWKGYAATIVPKMGSHVWGALWEIPTKDLDKLDQQEGVQANIYYPITVEVLTPDGKTLKARCYRQVGEAEEIKLENLPKERRPTPAYLNTMIEGAIETGLPLDYVEDMRKIPHNGSKEVPNLNILE
ncbi:unnamed protein product [Phyllotreta striolata]|uniref:gamma-glutamylcyclotransferase n=1 Tax=Phyllotreta striolata TaxID=444603 RepID=A0A9N9XUC0_PHYSR|nr:unnamed protein product [Phyllotreta striolata]